MYFGMVQCVYLFLFDMFLRKRGFHRSWFFPLALAAALAGVFTFPDLMLDRMLGTAWQQTWAFRILTLFALIVIYPLQSILMLKALKLFPDTGSSFLERAIWRAFLYFVVMMITSWIVTIAILLLLGIPGLVVYLWIRFA